MKKLYLVVFTLVLLSACKKEKDTVPSSTPLTPAASYDTISFGNYYPVYPGSWWTYKINDTTTLTLNATGYVLRSVGNVPHYTKYYVPKLGAGYVWGYERETCNFLSGSCMPILMTFMSETVGYSFNKDWHDPVFQYYGEVMTVTAKYQDAVSMDSVLVIEGQRNYSPTGWGLHQITYSEYRKDIGLVLYYKVDTVTNDTLEKKELISYFINH